MPARRGADGAAARVSLALRARPVGPRGRPPAPAALRARPVVSPMEANGEPRLGRGTCSNGVEAVRR